MPLYSAPTQTYEISADQTTTAVDLQVVTEIVPTIDNDTSFQRSVDLVRLAWSPVVGATTYGVWINGDEITTTTENLLEFPVPEAVVSGWHEWWIAARADDERLLGQMQRSGRFRVVD